MQHPIRRLSLLAMCLLAVVGLTACNSQKSSVKTDEQVSAEYRPFTKQQKTMIYREKKMN